MTEGHVNATYYSWRKHFTALTNDMPIFEAMLNTFFMECICKGMKTRLKITIVNNEMSKYTT